MLTSGESFCYVALLKNLPTLRARLALLPDDRRTQIEARMNELRVLTERDLQLRWREMRHAESAAKMRNCLERYGTGFRAFSPRLQIWLCRAV